MGSIEKLTQIDYLLVILGFFAILFAAKEIIEIFSYFKKKLRLKTGIDEDKETIENRIKTLEKHDNWQYQEIPNNKYYGLLLIYLYHYGKIAYIAVMGSFFKVWPEGIKRRFCRKNCEYFSRTANVQAYCSHCEYYEDIHNIILYT